MGFFLILCMWDLFMSLSLSLSLSLISLPPSLRLGYSNASDVIEVKGRVACEISTGDELLLTELIFNGAFNNLSVEQATALLSCFVFQEKVEYLTFLADPNLRMSERSLLCTYSVATCMYI